MCGHENKVMMAWASPDGNREPLKLSPPLVRSATLTQPYWKFPVKMLYCGSMNFLPIGFKEWAIVCEKLGSGDQSIILRKGGIAEGRDGFRFKHDAFFLFPTLFHEQIARTTLPPETPLPQLDPGQITLHLYAEVEWTEFLGDWEAARRLAPFHVWSEQSVAERFHYNETKDPDKPPGIHVAFLRIYRLAEPWSFPNEPKYGGCRSWLNLPELPDGLAAEPVLSDEAHAALVAEVRAVIGRGRAR